MTNAWPPTPTPAAVAAGVGDTTRRLAVWCRSARATSICTLFSRLSRCAGAAGCLRAGDVTAGLSRTRGLFASWLGDSWSA
eukprot:352225-Chlamydomonas_euryale.AAC.6